MSQTNGLTSKAMQCNASPASLTYAQHPQQQHPETHYHAKITIAVGSHRSKRTNNQSDVEHFQVKTYLTCYNIHLPFRTQNNNNNKIKPCIDIKTISVDS